MIDFCTNYTVLKFISMLLKAFKLLCVIIPVSLIVIVMVNIFNAIISKDQDALKKAISKSISKVIAGVVVFIIPTIGFLLVNILNDNLNANIDLYTCFNNAKNISYYKKLHDDYLARIEEERESQVPPAIDIPPVTDPDADPGGSVVGQKYTLTDEQLKVVAGVCQCEQGKPDGVAAEATLIANRYQLFGSGKYSSLYSYVKTSGWWACAKHENNPSDVSIARTKSVIVDGVRTMPLYVDEHDCISCGKHGFDIISIEVNGRVITDKNELLNRSNYIKDKTVLHNKYGAIYTFQKFPCERCDPFGYTERAWKKVNNK